MTCLPPQDHASKYYHIDSLVSTYESWGDTDIQSMAVSFPLAQVCKAGLSLGGFGTQEGTLQL